MKDKTYVIEHQINADRLKEMIRASNKLDILIDRIKLCPPSQKAKLRQLEMLKHHYAGILGITYDTKKQLIHN